MGKYADIDAAFEKIARRNKEFADRVTKEFDKKISDAVTKACEEFSIYQQDRVREIFNEAVTEFYDAYTPTVYNRKGNTASKTGGLYSVLDIKTDTDGFVIMNAPGYVELYNPDKMHPDRSGNYSLFQTVFVDGYHGGASTISSAKASVWGTHPEPGVPYYRTRGWVKYPGSDKKKLHRYGKWGSRSVRSISPYNIIDSNLSKAESGEMYQKLDYLVHKYNDEAVEEFKRVDIPRIQKEVKELFT